MKTQIRGSMDPITRRASTHQPFAVSHASSPFDMTAVAACFEAYTKWLDRDLTFQGYAAEVASLPGKYAPPAGALLLARELSSGQVLGCIALRPLSLDPDYRTTPRRRSGTLRYCEIKRLWVDPAARGRGVARALVRAAVVAAEAEGYHEVLLDTIGHMQSAASLYRSEGFADIQPYYENPLGDVVYLAKRLDAARHVRP